VISTNGTISRSASNGKSHCLAASISAAGTSGKVHPSSIASAAARRSARAVT
jgi:hypothetical protein